MKKKDRIAVFPIIIKYEPDGTDYPYFVTIPDLDGMTEGKDVADAIMMAQDYIGTMSLVKDLPESNTKIPKTKKDEIATLVAVNISKYKREHDNKVIKKSLTIPNRLNELGNEQGVNFSAVLTEALEKMFSAN